MNIDIIGISETKLDSKKKLKIPGYRIYRNDRNSNGGGVALAVKRQIPHDQTVLPVVRNFESVGISIRTSLGKITLIQAYVPPRNRIFKTEIVKFFQNDNKVILMGDFNAKHRAWNCYTNNANGNAILKYVTNYHISFNSPEVPTHFSKRGKPSVLDFFLIKNLPRATKVKTLPILNSDHNPVYIIISEKLPPINTLVYNYKKANWDNFKIEINQHLNLKFHLKNRIHIYRIHI